MRNILFVDACVKRDVSRTEALAQAYLHKYCVQNAQVNSVWLEVEQLPNLDEDLLEARNDCVERKDFQGREFSYARQWVQADEIVIAAPYWDLSFPAMLKTYMEHLCVNGLTFSYNEQGIPVGHCKASKLTYITTVGGYAGDYNMGFDYVAALCKLYFGIENVECIKAEGLDIVGNDPVAIMREAIAAL